MTIMDIAITVLFTVGTVALAGAGILWMATSVRKAKGREISVQSVEEQQIPTGLSNLLSIIQEQEALIRELMSLKAHQHSMNHQPLYRTNHLETQFQNHYPAERLQSPNNYLTVTVQTVKKNIQGVVDSFPHKLRIENLIIKPNTPMIHIKYAPDFSLGDPHINELISHYQLKLAESMDAFVRQAISKVMSDMSVALFVDTNSAIPKMDLEITFNSPSDKVVRVLFQDQEIGRARFTTEIDHLEDGSKSIKTTLSEVTI